MARSSTWKQRVLGPVVVATLTLALAGCGGDDGDAGSSSTTAASAAEGADTTRAVGVTEPAPTDTTPTPDPATPTSSEPEGSEGGATDPACLQGDWEIESDALHAFYGNFMSGVGEIVQVNGAMLLSFDAETYIMSTDGPVSMHMRVQGIDTVASLDGATAGTYTATDDGVISTAPDRNDFTVTGKVAGVEMDLSGAGLPTDQMFAFSIFECQGDTLRLETQSAGAAPSAFLELRAV